MLKQEYFDFLEKLIQEREILLGVYNPNIFGGISYTVPEILHHQCWEFSNKFVEKFPWLTLERGKVFGIEHWWCVDQDGTIVDPTAEQFVSVPKDKDYEVFDPDTTECYIGKCTNCGEKFFAIPNSEKAKNWNGYCDEKCENEYVEYCDTAWRKM